MSSPPLAALHINPPPDPMDSIGKLVMLKNALAQQQLIPGQVQAQKQQLEAGAQENQMRAQQIKDQQAMTQAMQEWDGKDIKALPGLVIKHGASAQAVMTLKTGIIKQQQDLANLSKDQLANQATVSDQLLGHIDTLKGITDPVQRAAAAKDQANQILSSPIAKMLDPQTAQMIQGMAQGQVVPNDDQLSIFEKGLTAHSKQIDEAVKASEAQKNTAQAGDAAAQQKKTEAETSLFAGPLAEARYRSILQKVSSKIPITAEEGAFARGYEASQAKTTTQADSLGVTSTNTSRPAGLATVSKAPIPTAQPAQNVKQSIPNAQPSSNQPQTLKDSLVDMIGQYKLNPQMLSRMTVKHPEILAQVNQKYPDFQQSNYNAANKAVTDLAPSGKTGQQITSYNTFLRHAGALYDAVGTLDNSKYSDLLNKPLNWLAQHTGDPRVADFMAAMQPPMKEFQSFLLNNHAMHEEDVKDAHSLIDQNKTPQEIRAVLKRFAETGSARLSEQNESFKRVTGRDIPNLVSPAAAAAYNKITGTNPQIAQPSAPASTGGFDWNSHPKVNP